MPKHYLPVPPSPIVPPPRRRHHNAVANPIAAVAAAAEEQQPPPAKVAKLDHEQIDNVNFGNIANHQAGAFVLNNTNNDDTDDNNNNVNRHDESAAAAMAGAEAGGGDMASQHLTTDGGGMTPMNTEESTMPLEQSVMATSAATTNTTMELETGAATMPPLTEGDGGEMDEETSKVIDMAVDAVDKANLPTLPQQQQHNGGEDYYNDKKMKKDRKEFTAEEKIAILNELNSPNPPKVQELLEKHGVSKSSLHRWRQPETLERLQDMVNNGKGSVKRGTGEGVSNDETTTSVVAAATTTTTSNAPTDNHYRKRDMNDKLRRIKQELQDYCKDNLNKSEDEQLAITSSLITLKAIEFKNDLLKRHRETTPNLLSDEEVVAYEAFKGSKSWACQIGNQMGYLSAIGDVKWSDKAKENTAAYIEQHTGPPKVKKQRMEFTAQEKLAIIMELEDAKKSENRPMVTVEDVCRKHHTSKSSLHRWKQQYKSGRLQQLAQSNSGYSNVKRVFADKFYTLKKALNEFYIENENAPLDKKVVISYASLQSRAMVERDLILEKHYAAIMATQQQQQQGSGNSEEGQPQQQVGDTDEQMALVIQSDDEVNALKNFKASNSWLREAARKFGWKLDVLESNKNANAVGTMVDSVMAGTAPEVYNHPAARNEQFAVLQQQADIVHTPPRDQQMEAQQQQQQALPPGPLPVLDAGPQPPQEATTNVEDQQLPPSPEHHVDHLAVYEDDNGNDVDAMLEEDPFGGATINI